MGSFQVPFVPESQLCECLEIQDNQLIRPDGKNYIPSQPAIALNDAAVLSFLARELLTPLLNQMSPWLWLISTPRSTHVTPLRASAVRGRKIIITEDPELHLVWIRNRVFIKPIPTYLFSHAFWSYFLVSGRSSPEVCYETRRSILQAALGYVRTYVHLIRHESDLRVAKEEHLIPQDVTFEQWTAFIKNFKYVEDRQVAPRYHYGDLRLTRLNFWAKPILWRWQFRKETWQYSDYFANYVAPLLFIFTTWSVVLSGMQVGLSSRPQWNLFADVSAWFSVATLVGVAAVMILLAALFCLLAGREIVYAVKAQLRKRFDQNVGGGPLKALKEDFV